MKKINLTLLSLSLLTQSIPAGADDFSTLTDIPAESLARHELEQISGQGQGQGFDPDWLTLWSFVWGKAQGKTNSEAARDALKVGVAATVLKNAGTTQSNPIILTTVQQPAVNVAPVVVVQPSPVYPYFPTQTSGISNLGVAASVISAANTNQGNSSANSGLLSLIQPSLSNPNSLAGYLDRQAIASQATYTPGGAGTLQGIENWSKNKANESGNLTILQSLQQNLNRSNFFSNLPNKATGG